MLERQPKKKEKLFMQLEELMQTLALLNLMLLSMHLTLKSLLKQLLQHASTLMSQLRIFRTTSLVILLRACSVPTQRVSKIGLHVKILFILCMVMWLMRDLALLAEVL